MSQDMVMVLVNKQCMPQSECDAKTPLSIEAVCGRNGTRVYVGRVPRLERVPTPVIPVLLKKRQLVTEPVMLFWNTAPPCVLPELLMNWLVTITLVESACDTAPPDCPALFKVKTEPVILLWLPESTNMAPPACNTFVSASLTCSFC